MIKTAINDRKKVTMAATNFRRLLILGCFSTLIVGCGSNAEDVDDAKSIFASGQGKLVSEIDFTEIHILEGSVCGYADGAKFYSAETGSGRHSIPVDYEGMPETLLKAINQSFVECMNSGKQSS